MADVSDSEDHSEAAQIHKPGGMVSFFCFCALSILVAKDPANNLSSYKEAFEIEKCKALKESHWHSWCLTVDLILLACGGDDIEENVKLELLKKLGNYYEKK